MGAGICIILAEETHDAAERTKTPLKDNTMKNSWRAFKENNVISYVRGNSNTEHSTHKGGALR